MEIEEIKLIEIAKGHDPEGELKTGVYTVGSVHDGNYLINTGKNLQRYCKQYPNNTSYTKEHCHEKISIAVEWKDVSILCEKWLNSTIVIYKNEEYKFEGEQHLKLFDLLYNNAADVCHMSFKDILELMN